MLLPMRFGAHPPDCELTFFNTLQIQLDTSISCSVSFFIAFGGDVIYESVAQVPVYASERGRNRLRYH